MVSLGNADEGVALGAPLVGVHEGADPGDVALEGEDRQKVVVEQVNYDKADLKKGDVLKKVGQLAVKNPFDVERALWSHKAGDKLEATVLRGGKETILTVTLILGEALTCLSIEGVDITQK